MFKIKVTDKLKIYHRNYFEKKINPYLIKDKQIEFDDNDIKEINKGKKQLFLKYNFQMLHNEFLKYCNNNFERISIGDFNELKNVQDEIEKLFPDIVGLINNKDFKFSSNHKKYKGKMYWEALMDIFGYNKFIKCDVYDIIYDMCKNCYRIENLHIEDNRISIQNNIITMTKEMFPTIEKKIEKEFGTIDKNNVYTMANFKKKYIKFERKYTLAIKATDFIKIESYGVWNAYFFIYESNLRTCPYCNRQYITSVLTSTGKMRATLDHFLPKNKYPYFSMSLYNLVPSCYNCNSSLKGDDNISFNDINPYNENIDDYIRFFADIRLRHKINIRVLHKKIDKDNQNKKYAKVTKYIDMFKLENQYIYHTNQVEELITKRYMYSEQQIKDMIKKSLSNFNISEKQLREQIIGYTEDKLKINDEPLSKFRHDIVEQLGFFDDYDLYLENKLEEILNDK